ncbi:MAG: GatB/YqeY domain-containing protein [Bacteroidetes bacterium]|jgi:uncharacterized protein YqeY|nr:GatB/YqeY domain-containing protein [Bacteroidota bacterium]
MTLTDQLQADLKDAMRAKDRVRLRTIRSLRTALTEKEIELRSSSEAMSDEDALRVVQKQAKQRRDAIEQYAEAGREDLVRKEEEELEIIETYLPEQLGDDAIRKVLHEIIAATGAASPRDMGKVMGAAMKRLRGRADGRRINELAQELLTGAAS